MKESERLAIIQLRKKIQQHEHTITQLVEIIAVTNRRITAVEAKQKENVPKYSLT